MRSAFGAQHGLSSARAWAILGLAAAIGAIGAVGCHDARANEASAKPASSAAGQNVSVEPRAKLLPTFPCSSCHQHLKPNPEKRELKEFHTVRNKELHHGDSAAWCYQCHSQTNIDRLVIARGDLVTFDEAFLLCGSCHGDKLRDWKLAIHGKTMGHWRGDKIKRSCTGCHNPHAPKFPAIEPEEAPWPPTGMKPH